MFLTFSIINKKEWIDIGIYLLKMYNLLFISSVFIEVILDYKNIWGAFNYIKSYDDVFKLPEQIGKSYANHPKDKLNLKESYLESLIRTMLIAAPILKNNETLTINNIMLKTYYLNQLTNIVKEGSEIYIEHFNCTFTRQATVELGILCLIFSYAQNILWDPSLPKK